MKLKTLLMTLLVVAGMSSATFAQQKIGHASVEYILAYMPETKSMNQQLQTFQKKLSEKLAIKEEYARDKYVQYLEIQQTDEADPRLKSLEEELLKLDKEIREFAAASEEKLLKKRQELLEPVLDKLQRTIDSVAETNGYDYVLNTVDGTANSIILYGPDEDDLTERIMTKLGIKMSDN